MPEELAKLRVGSFGERRSADVRLFLEAVEDSHDGLLAFLNLFDREARIVTSRRPDPRQALNYLERGGDAERIRRSLVGRNEQLLVTGVAIASPGIWEFLGALNPLTALNTYLEGRHERRKDRQYKEGAERTRLDLENERLILENQLLETKVVQERLQLAQALGLYPEDQRQLLERLAIDPMIKLARAADRGMTFPASAFHEVRRNESQAIQGSDAGPVRLINPATEPPAASATAEASPS